MTFSTGKSEYTSWDSGQPDNGGGKQDCANNNNSKRIGRWDDSTCTENFQVMCEASGKICSIFPIINVIFFHQLLHIAWYETFIIYIYSNL